MSPNNRRESSLLQVFWGPVHYIHSLYVWAKLIFHGFMNSQMKEPKKITNEEYEKTYVQAETSARGEPVPEDIVDFPVNEPLLQALEGVSEAIYTICISKWHCPPEEMKKQPLFRVINTGIRDIYYTAKAKVRPLEEYEILIAVVNALITHLKNFRKNKITYRYNTPQEEADFLRKQTKYLLLHWLPDSLRNSSHIMVVLNEILSINVLKPSINNLADPTFINEMIVKSLAEASEELHEKKACYETHSVLYEPCAIRENADNTSPMYASDNIPLRKKKGVVNKLKERMNRWKIGKREKHSEFRSFTGTFDSTDGCTDTGLSDESDLVPSISDSVLQKLIQENWTAKICENPTQERHTYKICVAKEASLGAKLWITEKSVKDFRQIYSLICTEYQDLKIITTLKKIEEADIDEDSQFFQTIGMNPDEFLDTLLELIKRHRTPRPIFFFLPFSYEEGKELFSMPFLDDDEEVSAAESETEDESEESAHDPNGSYESDGCRMFHWKRKKTNKSKDDSDSEQEDKSGDSMEAIPYSSEDQTPLALEKNTAHHMTRWKKLRFKTKQRYTAKSRTHPISVPTDETSMKLHESKAVPYLEQDEENNAQRKKLEDIFLDALYLLADELLAGGNYRFRCLHKIRVLNGKSKQILAAIPKLYAEDQIVWYLQQSSELLLADVCPLPVPPHKLPSMAQEVLKRKMQSLLTNTVAKSLFLRDLLKNITVAHDAFQNSKANKETLFRILDDLIRIITNSSQETRR